MIEYEIKAKDNRDTYVWGGAGVRRSTEATHRPALLYLRVPEEGETVSVGLHTAPDSKQPLGTLTPGECLTVPIDGISGVFVTSRQDTLVKCVLLY